MTDQHQPVLSRHAIKTCPSADLPPTSGGWLPGEPPTSQVVNAHRDAAKRGDGIVIERCERRFLRPGVKRKEVMITCNRRGPSTARPASLEVHLGDLDRPAPAGRGPEAIYGAWLAPLLRRRRRLVR